MITTIVIFVLSLIVLVYASNRFIESSELIGLSLGVSPFVIGVTIVAFGTSLPELTTSIIAVVNGSSEIVLGNVVGSNITNILLVLGLSAVAAGALDIHNDLMKEDIPLLFGSALLLWFAVQDASFSIIEAVIFLVGLMGFLAYSVTGRTDDIAKGAKARWWTYLILLVSGVGIYLGATYTIEAIEAIALKLNINASLVSLSVLALGTSLPEVVVSVSAARRGNHSMALGNVIGSNLFNTYAVVAIPSFFGVLVIPESILDFSLPFMLAMTFLFMLITFSKRVSLWKAAMLLSFYIFFLTELFKMSFVN